jgi:ADP-L-glycero-D-manno-heptose 6-epimerase
MILITGAAGFIGSNIAAALSARGDALVLCDGLCNGEKWRNLVDVAAAEFVPPPDLFAFLDRFGGEVTHVIHMGAVSSTTEPDGDLIIQTNFILSARLWDWCTEHQVPFVYASSAATYGDGSHGFEDTLDEAYLASLRPLNAYGWSKHLFDRRVARQLAAGRRTPPQWAGLKFFNVYGPREAHKGSMRSVALQLYEQICAGKPATLFKSYRPDYADGGQLRDFVWVGDCVDIVLWLLEPHASSGIFNVGNGYARSFLDLAAAIYRALDKAPTISFIEMPEVLRNKYQYRTQANRRKLELAGYTRLPTSLEHGTNDYVSWLQKNCSLAGGFRRDGPLQSPRQPTRIAP